MATGITEVNLTYHNSFTENDQNTVDFVHQNLLNELENYGNYKS